MRSATRWQTFRVTLCLIAVSAYLGRSAGAEPTIGGGPGAGEVVLYGQEIRKLLADDAMAETLATLDYTPHRVLALMEGREEAELERLYVCLRGASPRRALERGLIGEGYSERGAADLVASLTDAEVNNLVEYDSVRGGYVYVPAMAIAVMVVVGTIVLVVIAVVISDQAKQKKAAEHKARLLKEELDKRKLATELEQLRLELERLRRDRGAGEPLPPPPRF